MQRTHSASFVDLWIKFLIALIVSALLVILFIQLWWPAVAAFIASHWLLIGGVGIALTIGGTAHKTVPLGWKALRAIKSAQYEDQDREIYQAFLKAATTKVNEGYNVKYHNARAQESLELINPYAGRAASRVRVEEEPVEEQLQIAAPLPSLVRYEDIKTQIPQNHALVGIDGSGVVTRDREIRALTWVVGGSGTGKTNSTVLRVDEDYAWGHWFIPIDPHWFKKDSLYNAIKGYSDRFLRPLAYETEDIIASLDYFLAEFERRKSGGSWDKPITIIIDEVGSLVTDKPENKQEEEMIAKIKKVARICGQESRGFEMTGIYISQDAAGLAWLRKRAIMVIVHQLLQMSERLLACNDNRVIAREMDDWPKGRTLIFGIGFSEGQKVYQQPAIKPRVVESNTYALPNTPHTAVADFQDEDENTFFDGSTIHLSEVNTGRLVGNGKWLDERLPNLPDLPENLPENSKNGQSGKPKDYLFTDVEKPILVNLYNEFHNIDKCLHTMKKSARYHKDASRLLKDAGLL